MSWLRKILKPSKSDERDISQLIFDLAEHGAREADINELYRRLPAMELYLNISNLNRPMRNGEKITVDNDSVKMAFATMPGGQKMAHFFVDKSDPGLLPHFGGMTTYEAFKMVLKVEHLDGLIMCNPNGSWYGMLKQEINSVLRQRIVKENA